MIRIFFFCLSWARRWLPMTFVFRLPFVSSILLLQMQKVIMQSSQHSKTEILMYFVVEWLISRSGQCWTDTDVNAKNDAIKELIWTRLLIQLDGHWLAIHECLQTKFSATRLSHCFIRLAGMCKHGNQMVIFASCECVCKILVISGEFSSCNFFFFFWNPILAI